MSDTMPTHRATRRNLATQPVQRALMGGPTNGQKLRFKPIDPDELADIIAQARAQRTEEDIAAYATRKRTA